MLEVDPLPPQRPSPGDMTLNRTQRALITWLLADESVSQTSGFGPYPAAELPREQAQGSHQHPSDQLARRARETLQIP